MNASTSCFVQEEKCDSTVDSETEVLLSQETYELCKDGLLGLLSRVSSLELPPLDVSGADNAQVKNAQVSDFTSSKEENVSQNADDSYSLPLTPWAEDKGGRYGFSMKFQGVDSKKPSKSTPWTYSQQLRQLFARPFVDVPFRFETRLGLSKGAKLRVFLQFVSEDCVHTVVKKCALHMETTGNGGQAPADHVVVVWNRADAVYGVCKATGRHYAVVDVDAAAPERTGFTQVLRFTCTSSCRGGMSRRPVQLVFLLEVNGKIEGRACVLLKICASPGRDRWAAEDAKECKGDKRAGAATPAKRIKCESATSPDQQSSDGSYYLQVRSRPVYEMLRSIRDAFEACESSASPHWLSPAPAVITATSPSSVSTTVVPTRPTIDESGTRLNFFDVEK